MSEMITITNEEKKKKQKYSKGYNKLFNFLLPSHSTRKRNCRRMKYGYLLSDSDLEKVKKLLERRKFFGISFDETDVREGLIIDWKTGLIYGAGEPFHYSKLLSKGISDRDICKQVIQFNLILDFGLNIPIAAFSVPKEKSSEFTFKIIEELLLIVETEQSKCLWFPMDPRQEIM